MLVDFCPQAIGKFERILGLREIALKFSLVFALKLLENLNAFWGCVKLRSRRRSAEADRGFGIAVRHRPALCANNVDEFLCAEMATYDNEDDE